MGLFRFGLARWCAVWLATLLLAGEPGAVASVAAQDDQPPYPDLPAIMLYPSDI